jgi:hypothetical protein
MRLSAILTGLLFAACATGPEPVERVASATAAIRAAEETGARKVPSAALHLQFAVEQAEHARKLIAGGAHARAAGLLERAEADAEVAVALSREHALRAEAQALLEKVKALQGSVPAGS